MRSILFAVMVGVTACTPKPVPAEHPVTEPAPAAGEPVEVSEADAGPVTLVVGQELKVRLESNPSTGYSWSLAAVDAPVLAPIDVAHVPDEVPEGVVGAGGTDFLRFTAVTAGTQTLTFRYARQWETDVPPAKEVVFTVTVQ